MISVSDLRRLFGRVVCRGMEQQIVEHRIIIKGICKETGEPVVIDDPREILDHLFDKLANKCKESWKPSELRLIKANLVHQLPRKAILLFDGERIETMVAGITCIDATMTYRKKTLKTFAKFVSHPFWQYGNMTTGEYMDDDEAEFLASHAKN